MKFNWGPSCYFSVSVCFLILLNSLKRKTNVVYRSDENTVGVGDCEWYDISGAGFLCF